jgi:hypothetical protein
MIDQEREKLRAVAWSEVFPWLCLFRTFRLAIRIRALILGAAAVLLTFIGWGVLSWVFCWTCSKEQSNLRNLINQVAPVRSSVAPPKDDELLPGDIADDEASSNVGPLHSLAAEFPNGPVLPRDFTRGGYESIQPVVGIWERLSTPFALIFAQENDTHRVSLGGFVYLLLCGLWAVAVWAFAGGAITRSTALELAADERGGTRELAMFVLRRWRSYVAAPLFPLLGVFLATAGIFVVGVLLNSGLSMWIAAILWPVALVGGLMMAVLLLGLWFGWPLMWTTISTEGTDSFDALSRTYAYVFQKPLHYLFYILVAAVFGTLGWLLVWNFAVAVIALTEWAASWGCGYERMATIAALGTTSAEKLGSIGHSAAVFVQFWCGCVMLLAVGFLYSYFWTAATAIYLLMRRSVDATEMDEVFVEEEQGGEVYGLPKIETDAQGAPTVADSAQPPAAKNDERSDAE